jgi:hypothetical protein
MTYEQIAAILDRYWESETTLEEERQLKAYFSAGNVDPRLDREAALFLALRAEQTIVLPKNTPATAMRVTRGGQWQKWAVAASVAAVLGACLWVFQPNKTTVVADYHPITPKNSIETPQPDIVTATPVVPDAGDALPVRKQIKKHKQPQLKADQSALAVNLTPAQMAEQAEAEAAYLELKAALALLSNKLNKGRNTAIRGLDKMEQVDRALEQVEHKTIGG